MWYWIHDFFFYAKDTFPISFLFTLWKTISQQKKKIILHDFVLYNSMLIRAMHQKLITLYLISSVKVNAYMKLIPWIFFLTKDYFSFSFLFTLYKWFQNNKRILFFQFLQQIICSERFYLMIPCPKIFYCFLVNHYFFKSR